MSHLDKLEAEAIYIFVRLLQNVASVCFIQWKDSSVMMHLALKAFYPQKPPFPYAY